MKEFCVYLKGGSLYLLYEGGNDIQIVGIFSVCGNFSAVWIRRLYRMWPGTHAASRENFVDISIPQITHLEQRDPYFLFSIC